MCGEREVQIVVNSTGGGYCSRACEASYHEDEPCRYCGGECPTQPDGDVCDGFAGDIDYLYADEEN
jgi:hypothetical protein